jgi:hypothetical protein
VELLGDNSQIREERERAKALREKIGNTVSSSGSVGGFGSSSYGRGSISSNGGGGGGKYGASSSSDKLASYVPDQEEEDSR